MAAGIDRHLDEMAARGAADRRNGSYRRWLMTELGEVELGVPGEFLLCLQIALIS